MLIINPLIGSWREFQTIVFDRAKYSTLHLLTPSQANVEDRSPKSSLRSYCYPNNSLSKNPSLLDNIDIDKTLNSLKKDGFSLGINLPKTIVQKIWKSALNTPCYGNGDNQLSFYYADKEPAEAKHGQPFFYGEYDNTALFCPLIKQLENDPILLEIASKYLETKPVHLGSRLWWNFSVESSIYERRHAAQKFHAHLDDSRSLRFLFYITDVDLCSSPYVCVRGSHIKKKLSHRFLTRGQSHQEIRAYYGYENIVPICGKAGFGFVENPRCFHKENPPGSKDRLTLQIEFATKI